MPAINLLPRDLRVRHRQRRTSALAFAVAAGVLAFLAVVYVLQLRNIDSQETVLRTKRADAARLRTEVGKLQVYERLQATVEERRRTLATAFANDIAWSKFLNDLAGIMPRESWLTNLALTASPGQSPTGAQSFGTVTFSGYVFDFPGMAGWLTRVSRIEGLTFLYLTNGASAEVGGREVVSFGSNANVTAGLLSQRCQPNRPCP